MPVTESNCLGEVLLHKDEFAAHFFKAYSQDAPIEVNWMGISAEAESIALAVKFRFWYKCPVGNEWVFKDREKTIPLSRVKYWLENKDLLDFLKG